jgi:hypothetical protein
MLVLLGACTASRPDATGAAATGAESPPPHTAHASPPPPAPPVSMVTPPAPPAPATVPPPAPVPVAAAAPTHGGPKGKFGVERPPVPRVDPVGAEPGPAPAPAVDPLAAQFQPGLVAWSTPPTMRQGEQVTVKASVTLTPAQVDALKDTLKDAPGTVTVEAHPFTRNLGAKLIPGDGLSVTPTDLQRSIVLEGGIATFAWTVTAKQTGQRELILQIASYVDGPIAQESQVLGSFTHHIDVEVGADTFWQILDKHWEKLLTVVLLPLGAWLLQKWRRARGGKDDDAAPPAAKDAATEDEPLRKAA